MFDQQIADNQRRTYLPFRGVKNDNSHYLPLDPTAKDIRYLRLHAGSNDNPIRCSLGHTVLNKRAHDYVPYIALSYCWGDVHDIVDIDLCFPTATGTQAIRKYRITRNLHAALIALRNLEVDRILWIDAICISQYDPKEKTHQVGLLSLIFSCAEEVVVWLGEEDRNSRIVMRLQYLAQTVFNRPNDESLLDAIDSTYARVLRDWWSRFVTSATEDQDLRVDVSWRNEEDVCRALYDGIDQFLQRPWFRRIWVFQEILLSPRGASKQLYVTMLAGKSVMTWRNWTRLTRLCFKAPSMSIQAYERRNLTWFNGAWYKSTVLRGQANYAYYFDRTRKFESTDPRDKLFALLHLATDTQGRVGTHPHFAPNYEKSLSTIVLELASHGIIVPMLLRTSLVDDDCVDDGAQNQASNTSFGFELLYPADPYASFEFYDKNPVPFSQRQDVSSTALPYNATVFTRIARKLDLRLGRMWCKEKGLPRLHRANRIDWILDELSHVCRPLVQDKDETTIKRNILALIGVSFQSDPGLFSRSTAAAQIENTWFWTLAFQGAWTPRNAYGAPQLYVTTDNRLILASNEGQPGDCVVGTPERITLFMMTADKQQEGQRAGDYRFEGPCAFYPGKLCTNTPASSEERYNLSTSSSLRSYEPLPIPLDENHEGRNHSMSSSVRSLAIPSIKSDVAGVGRALPEPDARPNIRHGLDVFDGVEDGEDHPMFEDYLGSEEHLRTIEGMSRETIDDGINSTSPINEPSVVVRRSRLLLLKGIFARKDASRGGGLLA